MLLTKWRNGEEFLKRHSKYIAGRIPLSWKKENINKSVKSIINAMDDLKKMDLIKDYNFVKTSVYETSYFQIFFDKKKHNRNYIKRKENKQDKLPLQLTNVEEIEVQEIKENKRIVNKDRFEKLVTAFVIESGQDENDRIQRNIASTVLRQKYIIEEEI